jgi:DMSO reductase anchor subunit
VLALVAAGWALKEASWRKAGMAAAGTTPGTATGLGQLGRVQAFEPPHTGPNYLLREMGFQVARKHASRLRRLARALGFALPLVLGLTGLTIGRPAAQLTSILAALSASVGVLIERWLFFAEARHVMTTYYARV